MLCLECNVGTQRSVRYDGAISLALVRGEDQAEAGAALPRRSKRGRPEAPEDDTHLSRCVQDFFGGAAISGYECGECYPRRTAGFIATKLVNAPSVLVVHLKRFQIDEKGVFNKVSTRVDYGSQLDLIAFAKEGSPAELDAFYELYAVVLHSGDFGSGHYTALVRRGEVWYKCNDTEVTQTGRRLAIKPDKTTIRTRLVRVAGEQPIRDRHNRVRIN